MITVDEVYTTLANALEQAYEGFYCTRSYEPVPKNLPCMYFREFHYRPRGSITLTYSDEVHNSSVYVELYMTEADDINGIIATVEETMNGMYYIEEMCTQLNNIDPTLERYSLRFFRKLCKGDTI